MMPIAAANSAVVNALVPEWSQVRGNVLSSLPSFPPSEASLVSIVLEYQEPIQQWKDRSDAGSGDAAGNFSLAVQGFLLWGLLKKATAESRKEILGALWLQLEPIVERAATGQAARWSSQRRKDMVLDFVQEAYFCFEEALAKYDPKGSRLPTFIKMFYHSRMINIARKSKMRPAGAQEILGEVDHPVDEQEHESQIATERREELDLILSIVASEAGMASKVAAFKAVKLQQRQGKEIAIQMGRSEGWVSKACASVEAAVMSIRRERESKGT